MASNNISMACYSLRDYIKDIGMTGIADFLNEIGIESVEINAVYTTPQRLPDDVGLFADRGIKTVLLTYDGNNFFIPDDGEEDREDQFNFIKPWLDAAKETGISIFRSNMGHPMGIEDEPEQIHDLVTTFKPIQEYAENLGITYVFENHGGPSSLVDFQVQVKEQIPTGMFGFLLDTGNYDPKSLVYDNIAKLGSTIKIVHAKTYEFDDDGNETQLDFEHIIQALKDVGFDGYFSIEFEGKGEAMDGVRKTKALLEKYLQ
ncbi:MAG TPA: TIM barrel protein [Candidatus Lokiarchaeia archaeon]|nr:TIM barrel protein [Candidatus Lokiarchaeia archaeon]